MVKSVARKVMWVGRATTFMVGLAVVLALTVGLTSTALAGTGVGATFNLGKTNAVSAISKLAGSVAGPSLLIDNNSAAKGATALNLQVEAGKAPMKVNSGKKVTKLNADKLDGLDSTAFTPKTYEVQELTTVPANFDVITGIGCDTGDVALSAGFNGLGSQSFINRFTGNLDPSGAAWSFGIRNNGSVDDEVILTATCADFGADHQ